MFERFMICIVSFYIVCRLRYTASCIHPVLIRHSSGAHPTFILHSSCIHPAFIRHSSCIHPFCILVCILCVCPVYIRHSSGTQSFLSSSVKSYLRSNLTADSRTNLVPAIFHFFILFITFIYRCSRDLWSAFYPFILCVVYDTLHTACTRRAVLSTSSVKSYLRYYLTADSWTSPVPAIFHFFILFYYFHLSMFERFINCIVSFLLCVFYDTILMHAHPGVYPAVYPVYIRHSSGTHSVLHLRSNLTFGLILPRILEQVLCPRYSISRSSRYYTFSLLFFLS
jgi:hypothetical protein